MKYYYIPSILFFLILDQTTAQNNAQKYISGLGSGLSGCADAFIMEMSDSNATFTDKPGPVFEGSGNARAHMAISDRNGNLQFSFDCVNLMNNKFDVLKGADILFPRLYSGTHGAYPQLQGCIAVPVPGYIDEKYYVFYADNMTGLEGVEKLMYGVVDMEAENGLGAMISRDHLLLEDQVNALSGLTATRHGNGKDWWILCYSALKPWRFYTFLATTHGVEGPFLQQLHNPFIPDTTVYGRGTYVNYGFSPDGAKLVRILPIHPSKYLHGYEWFDFNRCQGSLSNLKFYRPDSLGTANATWSPNSRFIYSIYGRTKPTVNGVDSMASGVINQIDTWNPDPTTRVYRVAEKRIFEPIVPYPNPDYPNLGGASHMIYTGFLGQNSKVYITSLKSFFSTIHSPDSLGIACDFRLGDLPAKYMSFQAPPVINYRLYDWHDSPCDTLGINGYTSILQLGQEHGSVTISPNPTSEQISVHYTLRDGQQSGVFRCHDLTGRVTMERQLRSKSGKEEFDIEHLPTGLYFWSLTDGAGLVSSGKVVKIE
jgi:Secretion system C-terminal sorting domain